MGQDPDTTPDDEEPDELDLAAQRDEQDLVAKPEYPTIGVIDDVAGANPEL